MSELTSEQRLTDETIAREAVVRWMIEHSYATGHGDTLNDLLRELLAQGAERALKLGERP